MDAQSPEKIKKERYSFYLEAEDNRRLVELQYLIGKQSGKPLTVPEAFRHALKIALEQIQASEFKI